MDKYTGPMPNSVVCGGAPDHVNPTETATGMPASHASQHTTGCVLSVRALLHKHFNLPAEIISIILDHAAYWVCTTTTEHFNSETFALTANYKLIATSPLGHDTASSSAENEQPETPLRGQFPCRRIAVTVRAQAKQKPKEYRSQFSHMTPGNWYNQPPGRNPVIMSVLWAGHLVDIECSPEGRGRDQVFSASNIPSVLSIYGKEWLQERRTPRNWSVPVVEEALSRDEMEERGIVWDWKDEGAGGDLIRALLAGDALKLSTNHHVFGWGTRFSFLQVKVFHAI